MEKEMKNKQKKSKMPEGYIGRPKPMKTKTFEFHKPTTSFYVKLGIAAVIIAFIVYIVLRLISVSSYHQPDFEFFEYNSANSSKEFVLESKGIKFELNPETTQFTVLQKNTGKIWYSNPVGADSDPFALAKEKNNMKSPILLKFANENGTTEVYDYFSNSVKRGFYNVSKEGNKIKVEYTIGQMNREYIIPLMMYQSDYDKWTAEMQKSDLNTISRAYHHYSLDTLSATENKSEMIAKYPKFKSEDLYLLFDNTQKFMKEKLEGIFSKVGFTYEDYEELKEQYKESTEKEVPAFNTTVFYSLEGDDLVVEIPFDEISYKTIYPITELTVLPYFGAGSTTDKGSLFVPEGGGALINFNNGKTRQNIYYSDVYGWDYASDRKATITETRAAIPVFGIKYEDSSFISIIENGASYAGINAEVAGKLGSYNYVNAAYKMLHSERYDIAARTTNALYMFEERLPEGEKIRQVYKFVDSGSIVDMAKTYGDYLFGKNTKTDNKEVPVAIEIVGAIDKVQQIAGMPKTKPYKVTSYSEAAGIIKEIDDMGIKNANIKLTGFINDGVRQSYFNKLKFINQLGGKAKFKKFLKDVEGTSAKLYLDGVMQFAYHSGISDGFFYYSTPARFVSDKICELYEYSAIWYGKDDTKDTYFLLKPSAIESVSNKYISSVEKYNLGASFRDFGYQLSADYNEDRLVSREAAKNIQIKALDSVKEKNLGLMINAGNDYAVRQADFITNMNLRGNKYAILDEQVPFYQIALHGHKNYAGSAINLGSEKDQVVLESAETGAGLFFTFMKASEISIQETDFSEYYAANFDDWKDNLAAVYSKYNKEISKVSNSQITAYEHLTEEVSKTSFDNGYDIVVNFSYADYETPDGVKVPARDYKVVKVVK